MSHTHFFLSPVLVYEGNVLRLAMHRALVSRAGIYKVFEEGEEIARAFQEARLFRVHLDGTDFQARLARESSLHGVHYNLHLLSPGPERELWLEDVLVRQGFESPWQRDHSRVPAGARELERSEHPVQAFVNGRRARVENFSYHGLLVQLEGGAGEEDAGVGSQVRLQLLTSEGRLLEGITGRVARVYDQSEAPGRFRRGLGIRLLELGAEARRHYHWMILDACRELRWMPVG